MLWVKKIRKKDTYRLPCLYFNVDKNSKDAFIKKLQMCMKTYDYKDEGRDVKGKVTSLLLHIKLLNSLFHLSVD